MHEVWFVDSVDDTTTNTTSNVQSLRIHYTDWDGNEQTAWLFDWPNVGYTFVAIKDQDSSGKALNPNTCVSDKTCSYASYIDYVGTDGKDYRAYVIPAPVPAIDSVTVPNPISEGAAAQFGATAHSPIDDTLSYSWQFEDKTPGRFCLPSPCYANAVSGQNPTWTFPTSGTFDAILTVTDSSGRFATKSFTVPVLEVAPTLSIYPSCSPLFPCLHSNTFTEPLGTQTSLGGEIIHAGTEDIEKLDINWGDGTDEFNMTNALQCPFLNAQSQCSSNIAFDFVDGSTDLSGIHLPFDATHTYAASGTYTVTVTVTDQGGGTNVKTLTETVLPLTTTTLSSAPTHLLTASWSRSRQRSPCRRRTRERRPERSTSTRARTRSDRAPSRSSTARTRQPLRRVLSLLQLTPSPQHTRETAISPPAPRRPATARL